MRYICVETNLRKHVIIAGGNRSATTSLYEYLSDIGIFIPSHVKQTNYFLDKRFVDEGQQANYHYLSDKDSYKSCFPDAERSGPFLEASPDYLYSSVTAQALLDYFDVNPLLIFILRDPKTRIYSWYTFGKQIGEVPSEESYTDFLDKCGQPENYGKKAYRAIATSDYYRLLKPYYNIFSSEDIQIVFFEELSQTPDLCINRICDRLGLKFDNKHIKEYRIFNESCLLYTSPSPRDRTRSRMPSSA